METRSRLNVLALAGIALLAVTGCGGSSSQSPPPPAPSGLEVLYGVANNSLLNYFIVAPIDPSTGALSRLSIPPPPILCSGGIVAVNAQYLYVSVPPTGGCPPEGGGQIFGYSINQATGAPTSLSGSPFSFGSGASPQGLATVPNTHFLYVADVGRIDAFTLDSLSGVPTAISGSPFTSGNNLQLAVDPSGRFLYASDDDPPGGIFAFTITSTGALNPVPGSPFPIPGQTVSNTEPYGIVDTGRFVYTGLTASNQIAAFSVDSRTGALTPVPGSPFPAGNYPAVLALANNFLYAVNEQVGSISGYSIDPGSGALRPVPGSPFTSGGSTLVADVSGKYLYVSKFDQVQGYNIDATTGALTPGAGSLLGIDGSLWMTVVQLPSSAVQ